MNTPTELVILRSDDPIAGIAASWWQHSKSGFIVKDGQGDLFQLVLLPLLASQLREWALQ